VAQAAGAMILICLYIVVHPRRMHRGTSLIRNTPPTGGGGVDSDLPLHRRHAPGLPSLGTPRARLGTAAHFCEADPAWLTQVLGVIERGATLHA